MSLDDLLRAGQILTGPLFNEPMRVVTARPGGAGAWVAGLVGTRTERFRSVTITAADVETLAVLESAATYGGDGRLLRVGLQLLDADEIRTPSSLADSRRRWVN